jgi:hypothetical protein
MGYWETLKSKLEAMAKDERQNVHNDALESSSDDGKEQRRSERENDSACSSNGQQGSRGGYSGDCSSSDASSSESSSRKKDQTESLCNTFQYCLKGKELITKPSIEVSCTDLTSNPSDRNKRGDSKTISERTENSCNTWSNGASANVSLQIRTLSEIIEQNKNMSEIPPIQSQILPQVNGVRISHPMDPRIDLQTVDHISGSNFPVARPNIMNIYGSNINQEQAPPPSVDNYLSLMEVSISRETISPFLLF